MKTNPSGAGMKILRWDQNIAGELGQYHACWWPGSLHHQVISNHGIDYVE